MTGTAPRPWGETLRWVLLVGAAFVVVQALGWRLDPPLEVPNDLAATDLWVEGTFKAHEARRWALFGEWIRVPGDEYQFWRIQSPAHVLPLAGFLRVAGVTLSSLRLYSAIVFALGWLPLLTLALRQRRDGAAVALSVAMVADYWLRFSARSGLLEVPLTTVACWMFVAAVVALRRPRAWFALPLLATLAILTKQSGAFLAGFAVLAAIAGWRRLGPSPQRTRGALGWVVLCAALVAAFGMYATSEAYWHTVEWNTNHMLGSNNLNPEAPGLRHLDPWPILARLVDPVRWGQGIAFWFPAALPGVLAMAIHGVRAVRAGPGLDDDDRFAWWMLGLAFALLLLTDHVRLRLYLVLFPWVWWLAGRGIAETLRQHTGLGRALVGLSVALWIGTHGRWLAQHAAHPSSVLFDTNAALADTLTEDDLLVGKLAPWLAFDTKADHLIVRKPFNCDRAAIDRIRPSHFLRNTRYDYTTHCLRRFRKTWRQGATELATATWNGHHLELLALDWSASDP